MRTLEGVSDGSPPSGIAELFDHAPVGLWTAGPDGSRTYFNRHWLSFTGRSLAAERENGWTEGVHPDDFELCLGTYLRAVHGRRAFDLEYRLRRFDGEHRWMHDTGVPAKCIAIGTPPSCARSPIFFVSRIPPDVARSG